MQSFMKILLLVSIFIVQGCNKELKPTIQSKGLSVGTSSTTSKEVKNGKKLALIIGISNYAPGSKNDLDGIERDTSKMRKLFESWGFEVQTLYDSQSMKIVDYLEDYAKQLNKDDFFAFYYSGHGSHKPDENGDEADNIDETLVLSDGNVNKHLLDDTLYAEFNKIKAKKIIFLDSCHSGTAFRSIGSKVKAKSISPDDVTQTVQVATKMRGLSIGVSTSKDILTGSDYIVFSAAQDNEESLATPTGSLFTNAIYQTFTDKKYENELLKDIDSILVKDVLKYAKQTNSTPHHPKLSFSKPSIQSKSLNEFLNTKSTSETTQKVVVHHTNSLQNTLDDMITNNKVKKMSLDYQKTLYNTGELVQFTIDTQGERGFLTIFYVDGNDVTVLYPNGFVSPQQLQGKYKFPDDLANGKFNLEAYKSCKGCQEEETVIYTLLSAQQITDINKIKTKELISFPKNSEESKIMSRAVRIKAIPQSTTEMIKPQLGKYKFIVK